MEEVRGIRLRETLFHERSIRKCVAENRNHAHDMKVVLWCTFVCKMINGFSRRCSVLPSELIHGIVPYHSIPHTRSSFLVRVRG